MKHTSGPWEAVGCVVWGSDGDGVADLVSGVCNHTIRHPDEIAANARLIAAAPDMLKALEEILSQYPEGFDYCPICGGPQSLDDHAIDCPFEVVRKAKEGK